MNTKQFTLFVAIDAPEDWTAKDILGYYGALLEESSHDTVILEVEESE